MGDIYKYSHCNIGATGSAHEQVGLCYSNKPVRKESDQLQLRVGSIVAFFQVTHTELWEQLSDELLNKRAWVFQERYLAPSMVHFASRKLFWECYELNACQTFPQGIPELFYPQTLRCHDICPEAANVVHFEYGDKISREDPPRVGKLEMWEKLSRAYMACDISRPEDKLVALSGLAKEFQRALGAKYLAGLWDCHLVPQLLWQVQYLTEPLSTYRAPSWSWASMGESLSSGMGYSLGGHMIEILHAHVQNASTDMTGAVVSGFLRARASLYAVRLYKEKSHIFATAKDPGRIVMRVTVDLDYFDPFFDLCKVYYCMPVQHWYNEETESRRIQGLVLDIIKDSVSCYRRIGYFEDEDNDDTQSVFKVELALGQVITII